MRWEDDADAFALDMFRLPGFAVAAIDALGKPVAIGGVAIHTPGVGTAWMVGTDDFRKVAVEVTRHTRSVFGRLLATELHRIHAWSAAFHVDAHRWLEAAGMVRGEPVRAMGKHGEDFYLYSICREE